jgi:hypothetical protein
MGINSQWPADLEGETCVSIAVTVERLRSSGPRSSPFHGFTGCKLAIHVRPVPDSVRLARNTAVCHGPSAALFGDMQASPDLGSRCLWG